MGTMSDLLQHLARDIECATRRIWIATYIFADGRLGRRFARSFARAAARGVDVRVLYDAFGSAMTPRAFCEALEARGVSTRAYRPLWSVIRAGSVFPREHSRIVVVDDAGYVGGAGLSDEWLPETQGGEGWREVCLRVEGPCVRSMGRAFLHRWSRAEEPEAAWFSAQTRGYRDVELVHASCGEDVLLERYVERARSARRRIWVTNAYFCPPRELERELLAAAARGVDVRVLVPRRSDLPALQGAAFARYGRWLDGGMRIYEYQGPMLHAKCALVDDDWATVGTFNLNATAIAWVNETNLIVRMPRLVDELARLFEADQARSRPITARGHARRRRGAARLIDQILSFGLELIEAWERAARRSGGGVFGGARPRAARATPRLPRGKPPPRTRAA
jgi:cardiolipin synthase